MSKQLGLPLLDAGEREKVRLETLEREWKSQGQFLRDIREYITEGKPEVALSLIDGYLTVIGE
jgi:hypothetical protein